MPNTRHCHTRDLVPGDRVLIVESPQVQPGLFSRVAPAGRAHYAAGGTPMDVTSVLSVKPAPIGRGGAATRGRLLVSTVLADLGAMPNDIWIVADPTTAELVPGDVVFTEVEDFRGLGKIGRATIMAPLRHPVARTVAEAYINRDGQMVVRFTDGVHVTARLDDPWRRGLTPSP